MDISRLVRLLNYFLGAFLLTIVLGLGFCGQARATFEPVVATVVVAKPTIAAATTTAATTTAATTTAATTTAATTTTSTSTSQQVAAGGGSSAAGWIAFGFVAAFMVNTIRVHWIFCAQREEQWHKDKRVVRCYNAERDGLPEAKVLEVKKPMAKKSRSMKK